MGQTYGWIGSKHCLCRLIKMQPGEFLFQFFMHGKFLFLFSFFLCTASGSLPQCLKLHLFVVRFLNLPFPIHKLWAATINFLKKTVKGSLHLICIVKGCTKQATSNNAKDKMVEVIQRLCPDLPIQQKPGYLRSA